MVAENVAIYIVFDDLFINLEGSVKEQRHLVN